MDYKQKCEQLTKFIKDLYPHMSDYCKEKTEGMIPEVKESKDEKIRKALIQHIKYKVSVISGWRKEELIAWLEKQGEQKPVEWSEEDENLFNLSLENLLELRNRFGEKYGKVGDCILWLKSLKERMKGE